jgi:hypothetical protein
MKLEKHSGRTLESTGNIERTIASSVIRLLLIPAAVFFGLFSFFSVVCSLILAAVALAECLVNRSCLPWRPVT